MPIPHRVLLIDDSARDALLPLAYTRPIAHFRLGIDTLLDKWARSFRGSADRQPLRQTDGQPEGLSDGPTDGPTESPPDRQLTTPAPDILAHVPGPALPEWRQSPRAGDLLVLSRLLPDPALTLALLQLEPGQALVHEGQWLGLRLAAALDPDALPPKAGDTALDPAQRAFADRMTARPLPYPQSITLLQNLWDLVEFNPTWLARDFAALTAGRHSQPLEPSVTVLGAHPVFLEPDAVLLANVLDAREGPLYFGAGSEVMPGCLIRGPFALGDHAVLKMGAKIYGGTTIGPGCRAGGEISQSLLFANSNKGHDGFLGHSVLGEWCNLGADTNTSNLKNDYGPVKLYNAASGQLENTGRQFCGLFMGDHSKSGINTMFNTGTVVGVSANVFGGGFPPKFVPSFSWGGGHAWSSYRPEKALETARRVMARRKLSLLPEQEATLLRVFEATHTDRAWESP